ncbi:geranylgeranyl pyrophosphate synthase [Aspergillus brasiliensis]|nr:geranylgeranyl pyrophosphate synthase [Aspergillus brasiliensis]
MECSATWIHSTTIDEIDVRKSGAFTTLPVRISKYNEIAITTAQKLACIWDTVRCGSVSSRTVNVGKSLLPLVVPEALPERLATAVRLVELGHLCDAFADQLDSQSRAEVYNMLTRSLDRCSLASSCSCPGGGNKDFGDRQAQLRTLIYEVATEAIQFDREQGILILELLGKALAPEPMSFGNRKSSAFRTFWPILEFAIGMKLSEMDRILLRDIKSVVDECHMLNDEYWGANSNSAGLYQADFGRSSFSIESGKEGLRSRIIELEFRYRSLQAEFYGKYPVESIRLRRWIEAAGVAMASYNYWRALTSNVSCSSSSTSSCSCSSAEWTRVASAASTISFSSTQTFSSNYDRGEPTTLTAVTNYISSMPPSPSVQILNMTPSALNTWTRAPAPAVKCISSLITSLHNATTILTDINADNTQRYNQPTAHAVFGTMQATNSAYYTFIQSVSEARALANPALATDILLGGFNRLYAGHSRELNWKYNSCIPSEAEYLSVVDDTTGSLYTLLVKLLQTESSLPFHCKPDLTPLATLVARFVHLKEDYLSFHNRESKMSGSCDARVLSYPVIRLANTKPDSRAQISRYLFEHKESNKSGCSCAEEKRDACGNSVNYSCLVLLLREYGALSATRELLRDIEDKIEKEVMQLEKLTGEVNPLMRLLIAGLREGLL